MILSPETVLVKHFRTISAFIALGIASLVIGSIVIKKRKQTTEVPQKMIVYCTRCQQKKVIEYTDYSQLKDISSYCSSCAEYYYYNKEEN